MWQCKIAPEVAERHQLRQRSLSGRLDLPVGLPELRLDVIEPEPAVDLGLGRVAGDLAGLGVGDPVLGDRQAHLDGALPQLDAVLRRPAEVLEQVPVGVGGDDPQVDSDPVLGGDVGTALTGRRSGDHERVVHERLRECDRVAAGRDQVDVVAGLGAAPRGAGHLDGLAGRMVTQVRGDLLRDRQNLRQQQALGRPPVGEFPERGQDVLLGLRAKPLDLADPLCLGRLAQVVEVGDTELVVEAPCGLRAHSRHPRHLDQRRRELPLELRGRGDLARVEEGHDLALERLPDARELRGPSGPGKLLDRHGALADHPRGFAVRQDSVPNGPVELVQGGELRQRVRDLRVSHASNLLASGPAQEGAE